MIGKPLKQLTMADIVFNARQKRSFSQKMLESINEPVDWEKAGGFQG